MSRGGAKGEGAASRRSHAGVTYLSMGGSAREGRSQGAIQLREILNNGDNSRMERSSGDTKWTAPRLELRIRDPACKKNFADRVARRRAFDKFYRRGHVRAKCKAP